MITLASRRKRRSMIKLLRNKCNGRAPSSSQKLKFSGALLFVIVIYSKQTAGEGGYLAEGYEECLVDLALRVDIDSAEEHNQPADGQNRCRDELYVWIVLHFI